MQLRQFRREVLRQLGGGREMAGELAVSHFAVHQKLDRTGVAECVGLARALDVGLRYYPSPGAELGPTPMSLIASERLVAEMKPVVERARERVFGGKAVPFGSVRRAAEWIAAQAREQRQASLEERLRGKELLRKLEDQIADCQGLLQQEIRIQQTTRRLTYPDPAAPNGLGSAMAVPGSLLDALARLSEGLSEWTGFAIPSIVEHVLTGARLVLPRAIVGTHWRPAPPELPTAPPQHEAVIRLFSRDLTFEETRKLYLDVRGKLGIIRAKPATEQDEALARLVREARGAPERPAGREFWEKLLMIWNHEHPEWRVTTWRALEMRYRRLQVKLGAFLSRKQRRPRTR